jgi:hypothetical protein
MFSVSWDIINEPLNDDGTYRSDVFYDTLGISYIALALNAARAADPNAKVWPLLSWYFMKAVLLIAHITSFTSTITISSPWAPSQLPC